MQAIRPLECKSFTMFYLYMSIAALIIPLITQAHASEGDLNFKSLEARLIKDGYDRNRINGIYSRPQVFFEIKGVSLFFKHDETRLNYGQFLSKKSIRNAKKYMKKHHGKLEKSENIYGVDKEIIAAIILVETRLGNTLGERSIMNTLSTMAALSDHRFRDRFYAKIPHSRKFKRKKFEKKAIEKSKWAYAELKAFLTYTRREGLDPVLIKGSYAGALGIAQFMPSNILKYAKDGDKNGHVDLFNHADAIASIASYLKHYGWHMSVDRKKAHGIIRFYNRSTPYANTVLKIANRLKT